MLKFIAKIWFFLSAIPEERTYTVGELAYRSERLFAVLIDGFLLNLVQIPLYILITKLDAESQLFLVILIVVIYPLVAYFALHGYFLFRYSQTIGKRINGIRIENLDGTRASFSKIVFVRNIVYLFLMAIPIVSLINVLFIFRKDKRCLHDLVAKTRVCITDN